MSDEQALAAIAANITRLRGTRSKSWLARECGTYPINITRIEEEDHMPGVGLLTRIAKALDVDINELLYGPQKKNSKGA